MNTITITDHIDLDLPATAVWELVADYRRDPEWRTGVESMVPTPDSPVVAEGMRTVEQLRLAGRLWENHGEVVTVQPGRSFTWRTTGGQGADADGSRTVVPTGSGSCRLEMELRVRPHGSERLFAPLLGRMLRRNLAGDLRRASQLLEAVQSGAAARS